MSHPSCNICDSPAVIREVKKEGPTQGKTFWCCPNRECVGPNGKGFFKWAYGPKPVQKEEEESVVPAPKKQKTEDHWSSTPTQSQELVEVDVGLRKITLALLANRLDNNDKVLALMPQIFEKLEKIEALLKFVNPEQE